MADRYAGFISYAHRYAPWVRALQARPGRPLGLREVVKDLDLAARLYGHLSRPAEDLFRWIDTPKDGRVPLWREIPAGQTWIGSPEGEGYDDEPRERLKSLAGVTGSRG